MTSGRVRQVRRGVFRAALGVSLLMALAGVLLNVAVPKWFTMHDQTIVTITSGSMTPTIGVGDMVVLQKTTPTTDLKVGDIVTFNEGLNGPDPGVKYVSHRIVREMTVDGQKGLWMQTKGDANRTPDPNLTPES